MDFIVRDEATGEPYQLIQIAAQTGIDHTAVTDFGDRSLSDKFRSEIGNLSVAMINTGLNHSTLISLDEEGEITVPAGTIEVIPAWR